MPMSITTHMACLVTKTTALHGRDNNSVFPTLVYPVVNGLNPDHFTVS